MASRQEITCWAVPGAGLDIEKHPTTHEMQVEHTQACQKIASDVSSWTSHTVIIVDQSGSMRKTDVEGGATRSDAVWLTLAVDFIAKQIENKQASNTDVVSIIAMGRNDAILVDKKPHDWLLFNTVIDLLRKQEPFFEGNYLPALDAAEKLLISNLYGNCALSLFFLSDGKPSDEPPRGIGRSQAKLLFQMGERIDKIASRFGRRLTVITVGFAGPSEDFSVLQKLAERPTQFGSNGRFIAARLNPEALGSAFDSVITSSLQTRSELTAIGGSSQRTVRDVRRKARDTIGRDLYPRANWYVYKNSINRLTYEYKKKGWPWHPMPPISALATGVALEVSYFGEGAERLVREFREIGRDGYFTGEKLVAKESRFQKDVAHTDREQIVKFHKSFCDTQHRAQRLAHVFNERLKKLPGYDPRTTPTISFLDCSVYVVQDRNLGEIGVLVEKQIDPIKYKKWNDNCGGIDGRDSPNDEVGNGVLEASLGAIAELDEEDSEEEEEGDNNTDGNEPIRVEDIPQAFSHFTYRYTKRRLLVCDLQGVLSESPPLFELTDPVIHFRSHRGHRNVFGRTDHGMDGVIDFFRTHKCGPLCNMLNRRWVRKVENQQRSSHLDGLEVAMSNLNF